MSLPNVGESKVRRGRRAVSWRLAILCLLPHGPLHSLIAMSACKEPSLHDQCVTAASRGQDEVAARVCDASNEKTGDNEDLYRAANAYMQRSDCEAALLRLARLPVAFLRGEMYLARSHCHIKSSPVLALEESSLAIQSLMKEGDEQGVAKAYASRAQIHLKRGELADAQAAAEAAVNLARTHTSFDSRTVKNAFLALIDVSRRLGATDAAQAALTEVGERKLSTCDTAWVLLRKSMLNDELGHYEIALATLDRIKRDGCRDPGVLSQASYNRVWLHYNLDEPKEAAAELVAVEKREGNLFEGLVLRAYVASQSGDLKAAAKYLNEAERMPPPDADWKWELQLAYAELAERTGDDAAAERYYKQAIVDVTNLRSNAVEDAAHLVASHRFPFDGLIALYARRGRWEDALGVVSLLDASDMLRFTSTSRSRAETGIELPDNAPQASVPYDLGSQVEQLREGWRREPLAIVIAPATRKSGAAHPRAYRILVQEGSISGEDVGDSKAVTRWADDLFDDPSLLKEAQALSKVLVPAGASNAPLTILGVGVLGKVPLAALRDESGSFTSARRTLQRTFALREDCPSPKTRLEGLVIAADPTGNVPHVQVDAEQARAALGKEEPRLSIKRVGPGTSTPATREQLWAAHDVDVLYLAAHVGDDNRLRAIRLDDGLVTTRELIEHKVAPRIAVLANCGSAAATDPEGWGSIAAALLESGTQVVIATDRDVNDEQTQVLMRAFMNHPDWLSDPATALARTQRLAAKLNGLLWLSDPHVWAAFTVIVRAPYVPLPKTAQAP